MLALRREAFGGVAPHQPDTRVSALTLFCPEYSGDASVAGNHTLIALAYEEESEKNRRSSSQVMRHPLR